MRKDFKCGGFVALGLIATLFGAGCSSRPEVPTVMLKGHVVDPEGAPLGGIDVGYYKKGVFASDSAVVTESDGSWEFAVPKPFLDPPAGKVFFQDKAKKWSMAMHRANELPDPVALEKAPPPETEAEKKAAEKEAADKEAADKEAADKEAADKAAEEKETPKDEPLPPE